MPETTLVVKIDGSGARTGASEVVRSLEDIRVKARAVHSETSHLGKTAQETSRSMAALRAALGGIIAFSAVSEIRKYSDAWTTAQSRIRLVTESANELKAVQQQLFQISQDTRTDFSETVNVYQRLARATKRLGVEQSTVLKVSKALGQAVTIGGGTKESTAAGLFQLSQGIAAGALRGQELNSVLEQLPRVAQTIADEIAVGDVGALRKLAAEGKITSQVIIDAFEKQSAALQAEFNKIEVTFGQAMTTMGNAWTKLIGEFGKRTGVSAFGAGAIKELAENLEEVVSAATNAAVAIGTTFVARGLAPAISSASKFVAAEAALHTAVLSGNASYIEGAQAALKKAAAEKTASQAALDAAKTERVRSLAVVQSVESEIAAQNARRAALGKGLYLTDSGKSAYLQREIALSRELVAAKGVLSASDAVLAAAEGRLPPQLSLTQRLSAPPQWRLA